MFWQTLRVDESQLERERASYEPLRYYLLVTSLKERQLRVTARRKTQRRQTASDGGAELLASHNHRQRTRKAYLGPRGLLGNQRGRDARARETETGT